MIKTIKLLKGNFFHDLGYSRIHEHQIQIDSSFLGMASATVRIEFTLPITNFRNHDYTWQSIKGRLISNWYAPKIVMLQNNQIVQANHHSGIWEIDSKYSNILLWHFNPENSNPLAQYDSNNSKDIAQAISSIDLIKPLVLLFPHVGIEMSRSKIPFSAIACFTDHCDFDTLSSLNQQRQFFKTYNIKITKGFFLNHYSKRPDTACFEFHQDELTTWSNDGHELAYHSLSQSIKPVDESIIDFKNFKPPLKNVITWIDHGFQPYNVSLYNNFDTLNGNYGSVLKKNHIDIVWNYIDSGTTARGVINQLNPFQFTLKSYYNGINHLRLKDRASMFIKNVIFHYLNDDSSLVVYRNLARYFKSIKQKKSLKKHLEMVLNILKLLQVLMPIFLFWKTRRNRVYPLALFTPVIFNHQMNGEIFTVFQSLELIDFKNSLIKGNIDLLIKECGLFIAHTYFSAPLNHHHGRLFGSSNEIDQQVERNFEYLSQKIEDKEIWNPTLGELVAYLKKLSLVSFACNEAGEMIVEDENTLSYREVQ